MVWKILPNTKYCRDIINTMMSLMLSSNSERLKRLLKVFDAKRKSRWTDNRIYLVNKVLHNIKLLNKIYDVIESEGNLSGFLYYVTVNLLSNELRTFPIDVFERPERMVPLENSILLLTPSPERVYLNREFLGVVERFFTDTEVEIMLGNKTAAEIARKAELKPNTVIQRLRRKKVRFAVRYAEYADLESVA